MKLSIAADSQQEFDEKRTEIIKAIAGSKFEVIVKAKGQNVFNTATIPYYKSQAEMLEYWDTKFRKVLSDIKNDIEEIIG